MAAWIGVVGGMIAVQLWFQHALARQSPGMKAKRIVRQLGGTFRSRGWLLYQDVWIDLRSTRVTDETVHDLVGDLAQLRTLRRIDLPAERITRRTLDELRFVLPDCDTRIDQD
jgi:hypothetical protein